MTSDNATPAAAPDVIQDENKLIAERREKLKGLRGQGIAFPNDFKVDSFAGDLQAEFADAETCTAEAIEGAPRRVAIAGRVVLRACRARSVSCRLQDGTGRIQLFIHQGTLGESLRGVQGLGCRRYRRCRRPADADQDRRAVGQGRCAALADQVAASPAGQVARPGRCRTALSPALCRPDRHGGIASYLRAALEDHRLYPQVAGGVDRAASWKSKRR